jgi:hypothetical protein
MLGLLLGKIFAINFGHYRFIVKLYSNKKILVSYFPTKLSIHIISNCLLIVMELHFYIVYHNFNNYNMHGKSMEHDGEEWWHDITIFIISYEITKFEFVKKPYIRYKYVGPIYPLYYKNICSHF